MELCMICGRYFNKYLYDIRKPLKSVYTDDEIRDVLGEPYLNFMNQIWICLPCVCLIHTLHQFKQKLREALLSYPKDGMMINDFNEFKSNINMIPYSAQTDLDIDAYKNSYQEDAKSMGTQGRVHRNNITHEEEDEEEEEEEIVRNVEDVRVDDEMTETVLEEEEELLEIMHPQKITRTSVVGSPPVTRAKSAPCEKTTKLPFEIEYKKTTTPRFDASTNEKRIVYRCSMNVCYHHYESFDQLLHHVISEHGLQQNDLNFEEYKQKLEDYLEKKNSKLKFNPATNLKLAMSANAESKYPCLISDCYRKYTCMTDLNNHKIKAHSIWPRYSCSECYKVKFTSHDDLIFHNYQNHFEIDSYCIYCSEPLKNISELQYHLDTHIICKHPCKYCDKFFFSLNSVRIHSKIHRNDKFKKQIPRPKRRTILVRKYMVEEEVSELESTEGEFGRIRLQKQPEPQEDIVGFRFALPLEEYIVTRRDDDEESTFSDYFERTFEEGEDESTISDFINKETDCVSQVTDYLEEGSTISAFIAKRNLNDSADVNAIDESHSMLDSSENCESRTEKELIKEIQSVSALNDKATEEEPNISTLSIQNETNKETQNVSALTPTEELQNISSEYESNKDTQIISISTNVSESNIETPNFSVVTSECESNREAQNIFISTSENVISENESNKKTQNISEKTQNVVTTVKTNENEPIHCEVKKVSDTKTNAVKHTREESVEQNTKQTESKEPFKLHHRSEGSIKELEHISEEPGDLSVVSPEEKESTIEALKEQEGATDILSKLQGDINEISSKEKVHSKEQKSTIKVSSKKQEASSKQQGDINKDSSKEKESKHELPAYTIEDSLKEQEITSEISSKLQRDISEEQEGKEQKCTSEVSAKEQESTSEIHSKELIHKSEAVVEQEFGKIKPFKEPIPDNVVIPAKMEKSEQTIFGDIKKQMKKSSRTKSAHMKALRAYKSKQKKIDASTGKQLSLPDKEEMKIVDNLRNATEKLNIEDIPKETLHEEKEQLISGEEKNQSITDETVQSTFFGFIVKEDKSRRLSETKKPRRLSDTKQWSSSSETEQSHSSTETKHVSKKSERKRSLNFFEIKRSSQPTTDRTIDHKEELEKVAPLVQTKDSKQLKTRETSTEIKQTIEVVEEKDEDDMSLQELKQLNVYEFTENEEEKRTEEHQSRKRSRGRPKKIDPKKRKLYSDDDMSRSPLSRSAAPRTYRRKGKIFKSGTEMSEDIITTTELEIVPEFPEVVAYEIEVTSDSTSSIFKADSTSAVSNIEVMSVDSKALSYLETEDAKSLPHFEAVSTKLLSNIEATSTKSLSNIEATSMKSLPNIEAMSMKSLSNIETTNMKSLSNIEAMSTECVTNIEATSSKSLQNVEETINLPISKKTLSEVLSNLPLKKKTSANIKDVPSRKPSNNIEIISNLLLKSKTSDNIDESINLPSSSKTEVDVETFTSGNIKMKAVKLTQFTSPVDFEPDEELERKYNLRKLVIVLEDCKALIEQHLNKTKEPVVQTKEVIVEPKKVDAGSFERFAAERLGLELQSSFLGLGPHDISFESDIPCAETIEISAVDDVIENDANKNSTKSDSEPDNKVTDVGDLRLTEETVEDVSKLNIETIDVDVLHKKGSPGKHTDFEDSGPSEELMDVKVPTLNKETTSVDVPRLNDETINPTLTVVETKVKTNKSKTKGSIEEITKPLAIEIPMEQEIFVVDQKEVEKRGNKKTARAETTTLGKKKRFRKSEMALLKQLSEEQKRPDEIHSGVTLKPRTRKPPKKFEESLPSETIDTIAGVSDPSSEESIKQPVKRSKKKIDETVFKTDEFKTKSKVKRLGMTDIIKKTPVPGKFKQRQGNIL